MARFKDRAFYTKNGRSGKEYPWAVFGSDASLGLSRKLQMNSMRVARSLLTPLLTSIPSCQLRNAKTAIKRGVSREYFMEIIILYNKL